MELIFILCIIVLGSVLLLLIIFLLGRNKINRAWFKIPFFSGGVETRENNVGSKNLDKTNAKILFIDDEDFPVVDSLKKGGWDVNKIKDIKDIQSEIIKRAHIIFVDYKGVGKKLAKKEEGLGLIRAIKNHYGSSKRVILYSAYGSFNLSMDMRVADNQLDKNADAYQFITMIESELKKIK